MSKSSYEIRIYVGTYGLYASGSIKGRWIDLPAHDLDEQLLEEFGEGDPEFMVQDFEAPFKIDESADLTELNDSCVEWEQLSDERKECVIYLMDNGNQDFESAILNCENVDYYEGQTLEDLAYQFVEEGLFGEIPKAIENYLDYEAIARDLAQDYTYIHGKGCFRHD